MPSFSLKQMVLCVVLLGLAGAARSSDMDIQAIVDLVSQAQYTACQQSIEKMGLGIYGGPLYNQGTRGRAFAGTLGDKGNQECRKYLLETFANFGLKSQVQGRAYNVVAEQTGALNPDNVFIIAAHYDTLKSTFPGGDADASGIAAVLEAARVLSQYKFDNTIRYVIFNATSKNLKGSDDYLKHVVGIRDQLIGSVVLGSILHPYHDRNPALPEALAVGVAQKTGTAGTWAASFASAAQQFCPALVLDSNGPVIDLAGDAFSFVTYGNLATLRLTENSSHNVANASINTTGDASDGTAGVHYDYAFATNVVRAVVGFIGRPAGYQGLTDTSYSAFLDSDGDGYNDEIETALSSDFTMANSTPDNLPAAVPSGALAITRAQVILDFNSPSSDSVLVTGTIPISAGFVSTDVPVLLDFGGVVKSVKLSAKGIGKVGANAFVLKVKLTKNVVIAQQAAFSCALTKGNFKQQFQRFGLVNAGFLGKPVAIPFTVIFGTDVRNTTEILLYTATKGINGLAHY